MKGKMKNTLLAVHAVAQAVARPMQYAALIHTPTVIVHLGTGEYHGVIIANDQPMYLGPARALYALAFEDLRGLRQTFYKEVVESVSETAHVAYDSGVPATDFSRIHLSRLRPETIRKHIYMGSIYPSTGKALSELFWLATHDERKKFLVFERGNGIEVAFYMLVPVGLVGKKVEVMPLQLGLSKKLTTEAEAENEARCWYGSFEITMRFINSGVLNHKQWFDKLTCRIDPQLLARATGMKA